MASQRVPIVLPHPCHFHVNMVAVDTLAWGICSEREVKVACSLFLTSCMPSQASGDHECFRSIRCSWNSEMRGGVLKCACLGNTGLEGRWGLDKELLPWGWSPSPLHVSTQCSLLTGHMEGRIGFIGPDACKIWGAL